MTSHNPRQTFRAQTISNGTVLANIQSLILFPLSGVGQAKRSVLGHLGKLRWVSTDNCWAHMGSDTEWRKLKAGAGAVGHIWLILVWNVLLLRYLLLIKIYASSHMYYDPLKSVPLLWRWHSRWLGKIQWKVNPLKLSSAHTVCHKAFKQNTMKGKSIKAFKRTHSVSQSFQTKYNER